MAIVDEITAVLYGEQHFLNMPQHYCLTQQKKSQ
jgi:hypothetical protein